MTLDSKHPSTASAAVRSSVWVVDDNRLEREFARQFLTRSHDVNAYEDGAVVLELIASGVRPDVLVLDWHMPTISGLEICRFLRQTYDAASLPILVLTATGSAEDVLEGLAAGANDFVTKSANRAELSARVGTLVQVKLLHDALKQAELRAVQAGEVAAEANRAKDVFLGIVSHELRTPLNSILGWSRLLVDEQLDAESQRHGLETIQRNAQLQVRLIEDILDTTRIISGKLHLDQRSIDFAEVVRLACEALKLSADAKQQRIELVFSGTNCRISGDPERLQQAVGNLLANAIKFTSPEGNIRVELRDVTQHWELTVTDSGKGIDPELLNQLFDRFRQQDGSSSRRYSGLGLGLALVRYIAEAHGGAVTAHSQGENRGATFMLRLPHEGDPPSRRKQSFVPSTETPLPSRAHSGRELEGLTILLLEDDEDSRDLLATSLLRHGAKIREAATADTALAMIAASTPDLLVSDIGLPDRDGYEFIRIVRERGFSAEQLPAVALTAYARAEDRKLALDAGFQAYVAKPVDLAALLVTIARTTRPVVPSPASSSSPRSP